MAPPSLITCCCGSGLQVAKRFCRRAQTVGWNHHILLLIKKSVLPGQSSNSNYHPSISKHWGTGPGPGRWVPRLLVNLVGVAAAAEINGSASTICVGKVDAGRILGNQRVGIKRNRPSNWSSCASASG